ncbi:MAG: hypothetical protein P9L96_00620 [Candidatus Gygaella obscura]|nr:hypothetical protein [Candidatus Gygaella obscura]
MSKRSKYIINGLQLKYVLIVIALIILAAGITHWYFWSMLNNAHFFTKDPVKFIRSFYLGFLSGYMIIFVILVYFIIVMSNRTFGALFRIEEDLNKFIDGDKSVRVKLRKRDHLKGLAEKINTVLDSNKI